MGITTTAIVCMIVAMGLGRFALTPQLPHMIHEGQINLTQASLVAAANFLGYLLGAVEITYATHRHLITRLKAGMWGSGVILLLSAFIPHGPAGIYINMVLRFAAGFASAWVLVLVTTWVQHELRARHSLRALSFTGPGLGIVVSGILALAFDYWHKGSAFNWFGYGVVGLLATAAVAARLPASLPQVSTEARFPMTGSVYVMIFIYILAAIGYVLPATFLSKLAIDQFPDSLLADMFWPLFGLSAAAGVLVLAAQPGIRRPQLWLSGVFSIQALGILACTLLPGLPGLLIGAVFVGGTFMAILQLMMQLGARIAPQHLRTITGILTIGFAIGQFIGPLLSAASTHLWSSMSPAMLVAAAGSFLASYLVTAVKVSG